MGHGFNAVGRMCPPPRSLAAEANGASWSGPDAGPTEYKVAARCYAPKAGSPPIVSAATQLSGLQAEDKPIQTRYVTEDKVMPRGCKPEGEHALSNAERQARHRARQHEQMPKPVIRYRRPTDRRSRAQRWCDAVHEQGAATAEIARTTQRTAASTHDVSGNIAGVTRAASSTGTAAGRVLDAAGSLSLQAEKLTAEVNAFIADVRAA